MESNMFVTKREVIEVDTPFKGVLLTRHVKINSPNTTYWCRIESVYYPSEEWEIIQQYIDSNYIKRDENDSPFI